MNIEFVKFVIGILYICKYFTDFKLWVAVARHNFKLVKIQFYDLEF